MAKKCEHFRKKNKLLCLQHTEYEILKVTFKVGYRELVNKSDT